MNKDQFRISSGAKRIEVNDAGEYICVNIGDPSFMTGMANIKKKLEQKASNMDQDAQAIDAMPDSTEDEKFEKLCVVMSIKESICRDIMHDIDDLFHDEACRKVFGTGVVADEEMIIEFFEKLSPFLKQYAQEKAEKMSKYSPNRTGSV